MQRNLRSSWYEYLNVSETDTLEESLDNISPPPTKSDVMKLPYKDKDIFGYCSEYEDFYLVICKVCGMRIKPQSLGFHMELRHKNVSQDTSSHSSSIQETTHPSNATPSSSRENSDKEARLSKISSKNWSSVIKENKIISNTKHAVYVQPYPKPSSIESCLGNTYGKIASYSSSPGIVRTTLAKSIKSGNCESLTDAYISGIPPPEPSLSTCDSQTSMTVFLHHSFLMPNMKLCDIQDECADNLNCLNSEKWPQSSCLSEAPLLTQIIPEKVIGSPNQSPQIHRLNDEVAEWNSEQNGTKLNLNGMTYSDWNEHSTHFRPLPPDVQMSQGEQMTSHSFNCPDIKKFDDLESQVLIHNATMGT